MAMSRSGAYYSGYSRGVLWFSACVIALIVSTHAESCTRPLSVNVTIFPTYTLQCRDSGFSPDNSGNNFIVWSLKENSSGFVSIVVSAPLHSQQWAGLGFSGSGRMVGSTAIVATMGAKGVTVAEYFLTGASSAQVVKDSTRINFKAGPETFYDAEATTVYMAFQIDFATSEAVPNYLLFAEGPVAGVDNGVLIQHTTRFLKESQFPVGAVGESAASELAKKVKAHGAMMVFGWGVLLPIGAMVARYARASDPAWFYIHMALQVVGFAFIVAGAAVGADVAKSIDVAHLDGHKGLGVFLLTLAILQVLAVVLRPHKDAQTRKYWNLYHGWVGRVALFLACINIFVGFRLARPRGDQLKAGYVVLLVLELVGFAVLESLYWMQWNRAPATGKAFKWNKASSDSGIQMDV